MQEDRGVFADFGEGRRRPAVTAVGEFETGREGEGNGHGAAAVVDVDGGERGEARGGAEGAVSGIVGQYIELPNL